MRSRPATREEVTVRLLFFGPIGWKELLLLAVLVLLLFGTRLPTVMRNLGKGVTSFKKGLKEGADEDDAAGGAGGDSDGGKKGG
jgi:sec-independent protein translocase protein TatA